MKIFEEEDLGMAMAILKLHSTLSDLQDDYGWNHFSYAAIFRGKIYKFEIQIEFECRENSFGYSQQFSYFALERVGAYHNIFDGIVNRIKNDIEALDV